MKWTVHKAAVEFGIDDKTLGKRLSALGFEVARGITYSTKDIMAAVVGDLEFERIRETRARADLLERERKEKDRDLVSLVEVQAMIRDSHIPVRQRLLALPSEMSNRCNPTDPHFAREALTRWVDDALPSIRSELPQAKRERTTPAKPVIKRKAKARK